MGKTASIKWQSTSRVRQHDVLGSEDFLDINGLHVTVSTFVHYMEHRKIGMFEVKWFIVDVTLLHSINESAEIFEILFKLSKG